MSVDLEAELDRLYGVDLVEFVTERTRLAGALRKEGRRAEAERVKELRKPSLSVWVVNQLARTHRKEVDLLLDAGHRLAAAQRALLTGGDREAFEQANTAERNALTRLSQAARTVLGSRASTATLERVTATLRAAAVSDAARPELARGRLMSDIDLSGFDALTGGPLPAKRAKGRPKRATGTSGAEQVQQRVVKRHAITRARARLTSARARKRPAASRGRNVAGCPCRVRTAGRVRSGPGDHQAALPLSTPHARARRGSASMTTRYRPRKQQHIDQLHARRDAAGLAQPHRVCRIEAMLEIGSSLREARAAGLVTETSRPRSRSIRSGPPLATLSAGAHPM
jgi:hypothetical protein